MYCPKHGLIRLAALGCLHLGMVSGLEAATTITLRPDNTGSLNGDVFLSSTNASSNYGAAGALSVTAGLAKGSFDSFIRMDLASATAALDAEYGIGQWTVTNLVLELTTATPNNAIFNSPNVAGTIQVQWFGNDAWTEGSGTPAAPGGSGITWSGASTYTSGAESLGSFSFSGVNGTNQYQLTPSSGFLTDLTSGAQTSLWLTAGDSSVSALFNSRNNGTVSSRPALLITAAAVPEPGRLLLLFTGVVAGVLRRRRGSILS